MTHTRGPWKAEGWRGVIVNDMPNNFKQYFKETPDA